MDLSRYAELFLAESREHLSAVNHQLLELERAPSAGEPVVAIFRAVHTIKGMSATMGYSAVADVSHAMETLLDEVRHGRLGVSADTLDALFGAADALERAVEQSVAGRAAEADVRPVVDRLHGIVVHGGAASRPAAPGSAEARSAAAAPVPEPSAERRALRLVRVRLAGDTPLMGARAFLVLKRAAAIGAVGAVEPPLERLQAGEFGGEFSVELETAADDDVIEATLRAVGDVEQVLVAEASGSALTLGAAGAAGSGAAARSNVPASDAPAGADSPPEPGASSARRGGARNVRIDLRRLDALMNLIGELVITRGRLVEIARTSSDPALDEAVGQTARLIGELQDEIMLSRMVPVWQIFDRFPRLVRDSARALGKEVGFSMEGKEIELDRSMLDEIGDPIMHLLRNAIDHGLELPAERVAAGKPREGRLTLSAARERSSVVVRVSDDGRGVDRGKVLRRAKETGAVDASKADLTDEELVRLISRPGFSTAEKVSEISGRGVGIDVVATRVRQLGGSLEFRTAHGQGTTVTMRLPLTLAILRALLARVGGETYAVPLTHVNETVALDGAMLRTVRGSEVLVLREDVLPLVRLRERLFLPPERDGRPQVIVLEVGDKRAGLVVDELTGQQDIVVKQFDAVRGAPALFSGATILGDGVPALIVDVGSLI